LKVAIALLMVLALWHDRLESTAAQTPAPSSVTLKPIEDAYVAANSPNNNFGLSTDLRSDASPLLESYLKFDLAESTTGPLLAFASVVTAGSYLLAPILARRYGMVRTIVTVQLIATAALFFIPIVSNFLVVGTLFIVRNLLMNMSWPVASSFLMTAVDESERAAASAVTGAAFRLPFAMSTTLGGYLLTVNLDLPFFVTTGLYAVGTFTFWAFFRRTPAPPRR